MIVLITGGSGLVGSALKKVVNKNKKFVFVNSKQYDLTSMEQTSKMFTEIKPTYVIHLAAYVGGLYKNMNNKIDMFEKNMMINYNIIKCCHDFNIKKCIACLSTCIFPDNIQYPIDENLLHLGPPHISNYGYAYAKRFLDIQCSLYRETHNSNFICIIPTNIYGEHDNFNLEDSHVIPALIHKCYVAKQNNEPFVVNGTGNPLRQFLYSEDLANIIIKILYSDKKIDNLIISVPEKDEISIRDVANKIARIFNYTESIIFDNNFSDGQYKKTVLNDKLINHFNDIQFTSIDKGLEETIKWFTNNYENARR